MPSITDDSITLFQSKRRAFAVIKEDLRNE